MQRALARGFNGNGRGRPAGAAILRGDALLEDSRMLTGGLVRAAALPLAMLVLVRVRPISRTVLALLVVGHPAFLVSVALFPVPVDPDVYGITPLLRGPRLAQAPMA